MGEPPGGAVRPGHGDRAGHPGAQRPRGQRSSGLVGALREAASVWYAGVCDSLMLHRCALFLARSEVIRFRTLQCFMLNGVIFLGSIVLFTFAIEPALGVLRRLVEDTDMRAAEFLGSSFQILYKVLWIYPIYCISFVLNTVIYQEVADSAMALSQQKPSKASPPLERIINEAFRMLVNLVYILEMDLLYFIPVVGPALYFLHTCWLASIYCFEYRWVHLRWTSNERLDYFERHWLYFAGFGFPVSLASCLCPRFIDTGVFALLFPLFILTAATAEPRELRRAPRLRRLPVFAVVQAVSCLMLRVCEGRLRNPGPRRSGAAASAAARGSSTADVAKR